MAVTVRMHTCVSVKTHEMTSEDEHAVNYLQAVPNRRSAAKQRTHVFRPQITHARHQTIPSPSVICKGRRDQ